MGTQATDIGRHAEQKEQPTGFSKATIVALFVWFTIISLLLLDTSTFMEAITPTSWFLSKGSTTQLFTRTTPSQTRYYIMHPPFGMW
jgi:hypothetical protein